jgi:hypothetical protein
MQRSFVLTLEQAKEWFNSNVKELKDIALKTFKEEELTSEPWQLIKTYGDAYSKLGLYRDWDFTTKLLTSDFRKHAEAVYKVDIIRRALNGTEFRPSLIKGEVYYPWIRFYKNPDYAKRAAKSGAENLCGKVIIDGDIYYMTIFASVCNWQGLSSFIPGSGIGHVEPHLGLLSCKTKEIAEHMGKYFAKEIFDAVYGQFNNYKWIDK